MSVRMRGRYLGDKKVALTHLESGTVITTAAPVDNNGDGSSFSPTDLFASSLGACMLTILGIIADREGISLEGSSFQVEKTMTATIPRKVARISVDLHLPQMLNEATRKKYEQAAQTCPVHHSLHPDIELAISYTYDV